MIENKYVAFFEGERTQRKMRIYGDNGIYGDFFDTKNELMEYIKDNGLESSNACFIDYIGSVAGHDDVIKVQNFNGNVKLYTVINEDGFATYNPDRSLRANNYVWEFDFGNITQVYEAFKNRGVEFKGNICPSDNKKLVKSL